MRNLPILPSEELAYWVGVAQSDGYFDEKRNIIGLGVGRNSFPMLKKIR